MIIIPLEIQLKWIRKDLEEIKRHICYMDYVKAPPSCPECDFAKDMGLGFKTCNAHAPEFNMRIDFPLE